jgi:Zyg-11 family protein
LAHIASDGAECWKIKEPNREDVLNRIVTAIDRWDIESKRNINYRYRPDRSSVNHSSSYSFYRFVFKRSFEPILRLLNMDHTPQCQYWAVWALANLTRVYGKILLFVPFFLSEMPILLFSNLMFIIAEKYCRLLKEENGFQILEKLVARTVDDKVRRFAKNALEGSIEYLERNAVVGCGDEHSDELEG